MVGNQPELEDRAYQRRVERDSHALDQVRDQWADGLRNADCYRVDAR